MPHLNELNKKYSNRGLTVIGATSEDLNMIERFSLHQTPMEYKVFTKTQGVPPGRGIPRAYIIGPDGKFLWDGHPGSLSNKTIEKFLKQKDILLQRKFKGVSRSTISALLKQQYGRAYKGASRDASQKEAAQSLVDYLKPRAEREMTHASSLFDQRDYFEAYQAYKKIEKDWQGTDYAKEAGKKARECREGKNSKEYQALKKLAQLTASRSNLNRTAKTLEKFSGMKRYKGTFAAEKAKDLASIYSNPWK